jgi:hypothetical protein
MGISILGVPEEIVTVMVTSVGSGGAINNAFNAGGAEMRLPALASQVIIALGTRPFKVSGICSPTFILQSLGRMVTAPSGVDTVPQAAMPRNDSETAMTKITLRDTNP